MTIANTFTRDRFTWLTYIMLGFFAYYQGAQGVAMPLLRTDLDLSYTVGGMHISAMAIGSIILGFTTDRFVAWWGRRVVFWGGSAGMAASAILFIAGRTPAITLPAALLIGMFGTALMIMIQASLTDHYGSQCTIALTESNVAASTSLILPGLMIGGFERVGIGWRGAFVVPVFVWIALYAWAGRERIPSPAKKTKMVHDPVDDRTPALPRVYWLYWIVIVLGVAVEWAMVAWNASFMVEAGDLADADASLLMSFYFAAMMIGRITGSRLTRRYPLARLLFATMTLGIVGFLVFWLAPVVPIMVVGLVLTGLGVASLFPFLLSITMNTALDQPDLASSRLSVAAGLAILIAPQTLGSAADYVGIESAFGLVLALFVMAMIMAAFAQREAQENAA